MAKLYAQAFKFQKKKYVIQSTTVENCLSIGRMGRAQTDVKKHTLFVEKNLYFASVLGTMAVASYMWCELLNIKSHCNNSLISTTQPHTSNTPRKHHYRFIYINIQRQIAQVQKHPQLHSLSNVSHFHRTHNMDLQNKKHSTDLKKFIPLTQHKRLKYKTRSDPQDTSTADCFSQCT